MAPSSSSTSRLGAHDVVVEGAHPEARRSARHLAPDAPEADEAERRAVDVLAQQEQGPPGQPAVVTHEVAGLGQAAGHGHEQGEGEVRRRLGQHPGRVAHGHAAAGAGGHVDVVVAHGEVGDDPQLRPGRLEELVVDAVGEQGQEAVDAADPVQEDVARRRQLVLPDVGVSGRADDVEPGLRG